MTIKKVIGISLVVAVIVCLGFATIYPKQSTDTLASISGNVQSVIWNFKKGASFGSDYAEITASGNIGPGQNQGYWKNTTGRTVYLDETTIGYPTGTASSSLLFWAATSTSPTLTDYTSPTRSITLIAAATVSTSTPGEIYFISTTTASGGGVTVPDGSYVNFMVSEKYGCKVIGACETATSTNRGITNFNWYFQGHYAP